MHAESVDGIVGVGGDKYHLHGAVGEPPGYIHAGEPGHLYVEHGQVDSACLDMGHGAGGVGIGAGDLYAGGALAVAAQQSYGQGLVVGDDHSERSHAVVGMMRVAV